MNPSDLTPFLRQQGLPDSYGHEIRHWFAPLAAELAAFAGATRRHIPLIGIQGAQGSGKSTLAELLALLLHQEHRLPCLVLSLDDYYLTRAQRQRLGETLHPLFLTRGVPGSHAIDLLRQNLVELSLASHQRPVRLPRFDKARDDRLPRAQWRVVQRPPALILLEGWCIGTPPQSPAQLQPPVNRLEATEDPHGHWRAAVNLALQRDYQPLWRQLDQLVMLRVPDFDTILQWRGEQEQKLRQRLQPGQGTALMDQRGLQRFIQHYQRLTQHALRELPRFADRVYQLGKDHRVRWLAHSVRRA
jgi:D-glycerate 3-kinase